MAASQAGCSGQPGRGHPGTSEVSPVNGNIQQTGCNSQSGKVLACTQSVIVSPYIGLVSQNRNYKLLGYNSISVWLKHDNGILKRTARTNVFRSLEVVLYYGLIIISVCDETQNHSMTINKKKYSTNLPKNI